MTTDEKEKFALKVGEKIRLYRMKSGLSQEELAERCGLYRTYIGHLENGRYLPSSYILWMISRVLRIEVSRLFP